MRGTLVASVLAWLAVSVPAQAVAWGQFRGQDARGVAAGDARLPIRFGADHNVLWRVPAPPGNSSVCVVRGRVFVTAAEGEELVLTAGVPFGEVGQTNLLRLLRV